MQRFRQSLILIGTLLTSSPLFSQVKFTTTGGAPVLYLNCPVDLKIEKLNAKMGEKSKLVLTCGATEGVVTSTVQENVFRVIPKKEKLTLTVLENGNVLTQESFVAKDIPTPSFEYKQNGKMIMEPYVISREDAITVTAIAYGGFSSDGFKESNKYIVKGLKVATIIGVKSIPSGSFVPKQFDLPSNSMLAFLEITVARLTYDNKEVPVTVKVNYSLLLK